MAFLSPYLNIDNRHKVLVVLLQGSREVLYLLRDRNSGAVEMIATNLQSHALCLGEVEIVCVVYQRCALRCLQVDKADPLVLNEVVPVYLSLIVAHVNAASVSFFPVASEKRLIDLSLKPFATCFLWHRVRLSLVESPFVPVGRFAFFYHPVFFHAVVARESRQTERTDYS